MIFSLVVAAIGYVLFKIVGADYNYYLSNSM